MRLSWNEIRARAADFAREWADAAYEKGETQSFYNEFFDIFGVRRRTVARYEEHVRRLDNTSGFIDLFWPGVLLVEQKSAGSRSSHCAPSSGPVLRRAPRAGPPPLPAALRFPDVRAARSGGARGDPLRACRSAPAVEKFGFIIGVQRRAFRDQDPVNIEASELIACLHDALKASGYDGHDLELFLVRIVFCLFADDTGIFEPRGIFPQFIEGRTSDDGADLGPWLARLFQVLNTPIERRQAALDEDLPVLSARHGEFVCRNPAYPRFQCLDAAGAPRREPVRLDGNLASHLRCTLPGGHGTIRSRAQVRTTPPRRTS